VSATFLSRSVRDSSDSVLFISFVFLVYFTGLRHAWRCSGGGEWFDGGADCAVMKLRRSSMLTCRRHAMSHKATLEEGY
jgi:hypothetical protein